MFALACLLLAKLTNVGVPLVFKDIIDTFTQPGAGKLEQAALIPPSRRHRHRHRYYGVLAPNAPLRAAVTALAARRGWPRHRSKVAATSYASAIRIKYRALYVSSQT